MSDNNQHQKTYRYDYMMHEITKKGDGFPLFLLQKHVCIFFIWPLVFPCDFFSSGRRCKGLYSITEHCPHDRPYHYAY